MPEEQLSYHQRRRLQNRLAQRRFRNKERNREASKLRTDVQHQSVPIGQSVSELSALPANLDGIEEWFAEKSLDWSLVETLLPLVQPVDPAAVVPFRPPPTEKGVGAPALTVHQLPMPSPLATSITLPSMSFVKALFDNALRMGVDESVFKNHNGKSYIAESWALRQKEVQVSAVRRNDISLRHKKSRTDKTDRKLQWDRVPDNMLPTNVQLSIEHHPWIDVGFVWPSVRDKILCLSSTSMIKEGELCRDAILAGILGSTQSEPSFYLWGDDPMDEEAWEVSETFARKWWILLDNKILRRTAWWRRQRGLPPIQRPSTMTGASAERDQK